MKKLLGILLSAILIFSVFPAAIPAAAESEGIIPLDSCDSAEDWNGGTADRILFREGEGCITATGTKISLSREDYGFGCKLGVNASRYFELYLFVSDADDLDQTGKIILAMDETRLIHWNVGNLSLKSGWNKLSLSTLLAGSSFTEINSVSLELASKSGKELTVKIDDLCLSNTDKVEDVSVIEPVLQRAEAFSTAGLSATVLERFEAALGGWQTQREVETAGETLTAIMDETELYRAQNIFTDAITVHGRAYYENGGLVMGYGATGFSVRFYGTELKAVFAATGLATILNIYVDMDINIYDYDTSLPSQEAYDKYNRDCPHFVLSSVADTEYTLASGLEEGIHTVTILKRGEPIRTSNGILKSLSAPGGRLLAPPKKSDRRIEVIGDSDSAGFGNLVLGRELDYSPSTQDATVSYTGYLAAMFGAEYTLTAKSGVCLIESDKANEGYMYNTYLYTDYWSSGEAHQYDFISNPSDVVLISLGGNDMGRVQPTNEEFVYHMKRFIRQVRSVNPDAIILLEYGIGGGTRLDPLQKQAVDEINAEGDSKVYFHDITTTGRDGPAGHPSMTAHKGVANELYDTIAQLTGWTGVAKEVYSDPTIENGSLEISQDYAPEGQTVTFTANAAKGHTLKAGSLSVVSAGQSVEITEKDGVYSFVMPAASAMITAEFEKVKFLLGDVNGDEHITTADALQALQAAVGKIPLTETQTLAADIDGDKKISTADALKILQAAVGKIKLD